MLSFGYGTLSHDHNFNNKFNISRNLKESNMRNMTATKAFIKGLGVRKLTLRSL